MPTYAFDVAKANALLDEAGYKRGADGDRFSLKLLPAPYFNETKQFGDYLRQALAAIGIDAEIVNNDAAAHQKAVYTDHAFDLAVAPPVFRGDPAISTTILVKSGMPDGVPFSNQGGYDNAELDALIAKADETLDAAARTELFKRVPEAGRRGPAADQRRRMGLHHRRARQREERLQQSALGGLQLGGYRHWNRDRSQRDAIPEVQVQRETCTSSAPAPAGQQHPGAADRRRRHLPPARSRARRCRRRLSRCRSAAATPALIAVAARELGARPVAAGAARRLSRGRSLHLDLGWSVAFARPILDVILERLPNTLLLMGSATALSFGLGSALGIVAGARPGSAARPAAVDRLAGALCRAGLLARPGAQRGLRRPAALVADRAASRRIASGKTGLRARARHRPPSRAAGRRARLHLSGAFLRMMRAGMAEAWRQDFALAARAKGLVAPAHRAAPRRAQRAAAARHHARPAVGRRCSAAASSSRASSAVPGLGRLAQEAVAGRDAPLLIGIILVSAVLVIVVNLARRHRSMRLLDPRVGAAEAAA